MLESSNSESFDLGLFFLVLIPLLIILGIYFPELRRIFNEQSGSSTDLSDEHFGRPLRQIFLAYDHANLDEWCNWVETREPQFQQEAVAALIKYLKGHPDQVGALVIEVLRAVIYFNRPESFNALISFLESVRKCWGFYQHVDQFYPVAAEGLLKMNPDKAKIFLATEFDLIKRKHNSERILKSIIESIKDIEDTTHLSNFFINILTDEESSLSVKEEILEVIVKKLDSFKSQIIDKYIRHIASLFKSKISETKVKLMEHITFKFGRLLSHPKYPLWDTLIESAELGDEDNLLYRQIASLIADKANDISPEQLIQLFEFSGSININLFNALCSRSKLNQVEVKIINKTFKLNEPISSSAAVKVKAFDLSLDLPPLLNEHFEFLQKTLSLDKEFRNKNLPATSILTGSAAEDKRYLLDSIASKFGYKVVYVDLDKLIGSLAESAKLKALINQNKPALVYLEKLDEVLKREFSDIETGNIELLNNIMREFKSSLEVFCFAGMEANLAQIEVDKELQESLKNFLEVDYWFIRNLDKPDLADREKIITDFVKELAPSRIQSETDLNLIARYTEGQSIIEFLRYFQNYLRHCLLVYGYLVNLSQIKVPSLILDADRALR